MPTPDDNAQQAAGHANTTTTQPTTDAPKERKTVLETHGYYLGKTIGSGSYATVRVINT